MCSIAYGWSIYILWRKNDWWTTSHVIGMWSKSIRQGSTKFAGSVYVCCSRWASSISMVFRLLIQMFAGNVRAEPKTGELGSVNQELAWTRICTRNNSGAVSNQCYPSATPVLCQCYPSATPISSRCQTGPHGHDQIHQNRNIWFFKICFHFVWGGIGPIAGMLPENFKMMAYIVFGLILFEFVFRMSMAKRPSQTRARLQGQR